MRFYVSKNLGNGFRVGTSFSGKGCGSCLTMPFILIGYFYYYLLVWPIKKIIELVKQNRNGVSSSTGGRTEQVDVMREYISSEDNPFYKRTWFLVFWGLFLPPVGIALVWLVHKNWSTKKKAIATGVMTLWFIICMFAGEPETAADDPGVSPDRTLSYSDTYTTTTTATTEIITTTITTTTTTTTTEPTTTTTTEYREPTVWYSGSGEKYHSRLGCSNMNNPREITLEQAENMGLEPCKRCC